MSNLVASIARFSTAMTLFSVEQMGKAMNMFTGEEEFSRTIETFENTLNAFTSVLTDKMDKKMKETLQSVSKMTEQTVSRTLDAMEVANPREMFKASTDILQKTTEATSEWVSRTASAVEKATTGAAKSKDAEHAKTH